MVSEIVFSVLLVVGLVALAVYFGRRELAALRRLRGETLPDEEHRYERRKALRRLVSCALMLVLAALLVGLLVYGTEAQELAQEREGFDAEDAPAFTPQQKLFLRVWGGMWIAFLVLLLVVLALAAVDLWATRVYGLRQYRKLSEDRRAMIQRQANRIRQERNGHG
jgi:hypothetical protein